MNTLEDLVRDALRERAEDFSAHPDAWQQLLAREAAGVVPRRAPRRSWPVRFLIPAAAAAAVVVIVLAAVAIKGSFDGTSSPGSAGAVPASVGPYSASGPAGEMLVMDPPASAIIGLRVPWTGSGKKPDKVVSYFWLGDSNPAYWLDQVVSGPQFCSDTVNVATGQSGGFCWPLPRLGPGHVAMVTGNENVGTNQRILVGAAGAQVASVAAVLPDGRTYAGAVKAGSRLRDQAWTVGYPPSTGARLIFRDASGKQLAVLNTSRPLGPPRTAQPRRGGVTVFSYSASSEIPAGRIEAYLIQGHVGFWSPIWGGEISPLPAAGGPVLGGLANVFGFVQGGTWGQVKTFGYARAGVARVVVRAPDGRQVPTTTFKAGWPGSDLRLWVVSLPMNGQTVAVPPRGLLATAYDAAGHTIGTAMLGWDQ
jgi:hypothetical protein